MLVKLTTVVICSQGYSAEIIKAAYYKLIIEYLEKEHGFVRKDVAPITLGNIFFKKNEVKN
jgi:hypothetical protein